MVTFWEQVSTIVFKFLKASTPEVPTKAWKGPVGNTGGVIGEKVITAAIKVVSYSYLFDHLIGIKSLAINVPKIYINRCLD